MQMMLSRCETDVSSQTGGEHGPVKSLFNGVLVSDRQVNCFWVSSIWILKFVDFAGVDLAAVWSQTRITASRVNINVIRIQTAILCGNIFSSMMTSRCQRCEAARSFLAAHLEST